MLARAAAFLTWTMARTRAAFGNVPEIGKLWMPRAVWTP